MKNRFRNFIYNFCFCAHLKAHFIKKKVLTGFKIQLKNNNQEVGENDLMCPSYSFLYNLIRLKLVCYKTIKGI